ncbi:MAG: ATPase, T2SS/T4P/T4SS family [Planctomycetota bacterium]
MRRPKHRSLNPQDPDYAVEVINALLPRAIQLGASDIHLQPSTNGWDVWFRIDGVLSIHERIEGGGSTDPVTRLMVLAGLPTYRSGQPMEGRIQWEHSPDSGSTSSGSNKPESTQRDSTMSESTTQETSMRLGIFPSLHGPRAVVRLLTTDREHQTIDDLGLSPEVAEQAKSLCRCTDGAVLLCGPTGSGKTTTLYAMLRTIAQQSPRRSVLTIEDPVETVIDSISQSQLDTSSGMSLASALRSAVRQDSEVMLVSEIRDPETAEAAMQASLTGHLVFSSLHATDVASSLRRLTQMGIPPFAIRGGLRAIIAMRLLRKRCEPCTSPTSDCERCMGTSYRGRLAVAQCVRFDGSDPIGDAMANALESGASVAAIQQAAIQQGSVDLRGRARECVNAGLTDEAELYRVLGKR